MPINLSIKNVPKDLHEALRSRAETNRRSLNNEILRTLEQSVAAEQKEAALLERLRTLRARQQRQIPVEEIVAMIREDRDSR